MQQRADELARWTDIIANPDGTARIVREILSELCDRLLNGSIHDIAELERERLVHRGDLEQVRLERDTAAAQRDAVLAATSWRIMEPLRVAANVTSRLTVKVRALPKRLSMALRSVAARLRRPKVRPDA